MIYLDAAATTLIKPARVKNSVAEAVSELGSPGRGGHAAAMRAAEIAYTAREKAARLFHIQDPERVVFTFNATHGLNMAIRSLVRTGDRVLTTGYEHNAVVRPLHALRARVDVVRTPPFREEEAVDAFREKLKDRPAAAVINHVSNVCGYIQPLSRLAELCREAEVPFLVDASQSAGALPVHQDELGAAFIAMPGHKGLYGPQGTGLLLCGDVATPLLYGGSGSESLSPGMPDYLPDRLEAGTHNMPGIAGLSAGLDYILEKGEDSISAWERFLTERAADALQSVPGVTVWRAARREAQAGVLSFLIEGMDPETTAEALDRRGIAVRAGLHCAPEAHRSMGTLPAGTVRASFSAFTSRRDVDIFADAVGEIARKGR